MAHIEPLAREELPEFEDIFERRESAWGVVANAMLIMGRRPNILRSWSALIDAVCFEGTVDRNLKRLVALMRSSAVGCRYCTAHTASHGANEGVEVQKIEAIWDFESDPIFSDAERAAIRLARDAAQVPNAVTPQQFEDLRKHFDDGQIIEIIGVICVYAFINTFNDTLATPLEQKPLDFASDHLVASGWELGRHG
ncbi:MAG: carboxymuconolactone decarboxylase family protein [Actinobacteria bacterium]|nr:carboxymuconolactone decarboxylase family protein [Actinomycetota bacterium]